MLIGNRLRLARVEAGKTLRQTEEETGLSKDTISRIERGTREPQPLTVAKLAKAYGRTTEEFLEAPKKAHAPSPEILEVGEWGRRRSRIVGLTLEATELRKRWTPELAAGGLQEHRAFEITYAILGILGEVERVLEGLERTNKANAHQVKRLREEEPQLLHLLKQSVRQSKTELEFKSIIDSVVFEQGSVPPVETAKRSHA